MWQGEKRNEAVGELERWLLRHSFLTVSIRDVSSPLTGDKAVYSCVECTLCDWSFQQSISETQRRLPASFGLFQPWLCVWKTQLNFVPRVLCRVLGWAVRPSVRQASDLITSWSHREECSSLRSLEKLHLSGLHTAQVWMDLKIKGCLTLLFRVLDCITRVQRHAHRVSAAKSLLSVLCSPYVRPFPFHLIPAGWHDLSSNLHFSASLNTRYKVSETPSRTHKIVLRLHGSKN